MVGKISSGDLCTVAPLGDHVLATDDIVLCRVNGNQTCTWSRRSRVTAIKSEMLVAGSTGG
jgi:hypothetical protein